MKVQQHTYLSPAAAALRQRDGIPPWGVHPCEVDSLKTTPPGTVFYAELQQARELRHQIEGGTGH